MVRIGYIEARQDELEDRVQKDEKNVVTSDNVKKLINEEMAEKEKIESRKLNVMCFAVPESKRYDVNERRNEDKDFLINLLGTKLSYSLGDEDIIKPVRLGKRNVIMNQSYNADH